MFHLKFRRVEDKTETEINISCLTYGKTIRKDVALVTVHKGYTIHDGRAVEYRVAADERSYDVCFVTNDAGKTVDRIGPF